MQNIKISLDQIAEMQMSSVKWYNKNKKDRQASNQLKQISFIFFCSIC